MRDHAAERDPGRTAFIEFAQLIPRPVRFDEIPELRAIFTEGVEDGLALLQMMGGAAGCFLIRQTGGRAGRVSDAA